MSMKNIVALTGVIGSGKTITSNYFKDLGIDIIDTDLINNQLITDNTEVLAKIGSEFGNSFIKTGSLDRNGMRELIFNNIRAKIKLENILYPFINEVSRSLIEKSTSSYCILVVPLLFKSLYYINQSNLNIVLECPITSLYARLKARSGLEPQLIDKIIASQTPQVIQHNLADYVIYNTKDTHYIQQQVGTLHQHILRRFKLNS